MTAQDETRVRTGQLVAAVIGAYIVYVLIVRLEGNGRHFVELGVLRLVLFAALLSFARWSGATARRLGKFGTGLAGVCAVTFVAGAIGAVVTDGWSYDVFDPALDEEEAPWYAYVIGLSGILFALGTVLTGIAGRAAGRLAAVAVVAGATFPLVFAMGDDTLGHVVWFVPWLVLAVGLTRTSAR